MPDQDYIPSTEEDFNDFQEQFESELVTNGPGWGVPAPTITSVTNAKTDWVAKYAAGKSEADPTSAQRQAKNDSRKSYTTLIRSVVKQHIRNNPAVTNDDLVSIGLSVPDTTRTRVPVPGYAPRQAIDAITHLNHKLRITDPTNPNTKSKPKGVARINLFRYIGTEPPKKISDYQLVTSATKFLVTSSFDDADVGKKAWYIVQYENTRGERGPVSDSVNGTIA
jgi:hypothetical protein